MQKISLVCRRLVAASVVVGSPCYSALTIGDLAVVGFNSDTSDHVDEFAIVALATIPANEVIKLTDRGWQSGFYDNNTTEGTLVWQPDAEIAAGTVFRVSVELGAGAAGLPGSLSIQDGFESGTLGMFTGGGDQVLIYQGTEAAPSFLYGFSNQATTAGGSTTDGEWMGAAGTLSSTTSELPPGLENDLTAVGLTVGDHADNQVYTGTMEGTRNELLAAISNGANWSSSDSDTFDLSPGGTQFPTSFEIVPEPSSAMLLMLGAAGITRRRRRGAERLKHRNTETDPTLTA